VLRAEENGAPSTPGRLGRCGIKAVEVLFHILHINELILSASVPRSAGGPRAVRCAVCQQNKQQVQIQPIGCFKRNLESKGQVIACGGKSSRTQGSGDHPERQDERDTYDLTLTGKCSIDR
jgi:hypothetical protein